MEKVNIAVAWYRPEQWFMLLSKADDRDKLEDSYEEWRTGAEETIASLERLGMEVVKVHIDIFDLIAWCEKHGKKMNGTARTEYVTMKQMEQNAQQN